MLRTGTLLFWVCMLACRAEEDPAGSAAPAPSPPAKALASPPPAKVPPSVFAVAAGDPVPAIALKLHDGTSFDLAQASDDWVLVYFYPKDDTPGCTVEAQGFRDRYSELEAAGVKVIGVSLQDAGSHSAFIDKYELPFPLAVDDGSGAAAFGVPVRGEFAARHSFLIRGGRVHTAWRKVNPAAHAAEVLAAVR